MTSERGLKALQRFQNLVKRKESSLCTYSTPKSLKVMVDNLPSGHGEIFICNVFFLSSRPRLPVRYKYEIFGLRKGEASIIRNAAGRAVDAIRSLEVMGSIVPIGLVIVLHHTDCGALFITNETVRDRLSQRAPEHAAKIKDKWFGEYSTGIEDSVVEDVENVKAWPFLPHGTPVLGYVFELETGRLREVTPIPTMTTLQDAHYDPTSKL